MTDAQPAPPLTCPACGRPLATHDGGNRLRLVKADAVLLVGRKATLECPCGAVRVFRPPGRCPPQPPTGAYLRP